MIRVLATREGLIGQRTSSGWLVNSVIPFVALPSTAALRQWIVLRKVGSLITVRAIVLDTGPWNTTDDAYVFQLATMQSLGFHGIETRPQAETGIDKTGRPTNGAGIDLGEAVWKLLGMTDNSQVEWEFG